ncbi:MAG: hypothetical protein AMJ69_09570 [Gammaproteobacteria bacterium SG8_47]|nr:MAG: hypothetical protein AMJ69_09570 [Gammaproteobacteria bacterium SG8_47]
MTARTGACYAGFWRRLTATLIDIALYCAIALPVLYLAYRQDAFVTLAGGVDAPLGLGVIDIVFTKVVPVALLVLLWSKWGATPGKILMDCQIVDARSLGPISWRQALLRVLGYALSAAVLYLGFVWMAFDKRKQGWHDKIAKTVVLHRESDYAVESRDLALETKR